ncbi:MAG TPA: YceI family protein [Solirubrobacteraceae bacterium]|nr:YceI family protein [Solirubrobacteraceae bacterium]
MAKLPGRPRTARAAALAIGAVILAVAAIAFLLVYFVVFPTSSPKPFSLSTSTGTTTRAGATTVSPASLAGRWEIASGSEAGYRVREKLAFLPAESDAVGRTSQISGDATFTQSAGTVTIRAASFSVAVNTLTSDRSMRDEKIHTIGLESDTYPTATFVLSTPLTLRASALSGHVARASATGVLTIHGTSRRETVPVEMTLSGSTVYATGSLTFPWSTFNMTAPSIAGFVTVTDRATMEFDLGLQRS